MSKKILHIAGCDKFIPPFIEYVKKNFVFNEHEFLLTNGMAANELRNDSNVSLSNRNIIGRLKHYVDAIIKMHQAKKVILHSLFDMKIVILLFFMPWLLKKCYWVMWGGDLYVYQLGERNWKWKTREFFRRPVIKNMEYFVIYTVGDYELAQKWYNAKGRLCRCFVYTSNMYKDYQVSEKQHASINILVGNSADPSNNHAEVFDKLEAYKDQNIKIYAPLSYGSPIYAKQVIAEGKRRFGDKFEALTEYMVFNQYLEFLGIVDIAIFNHNRQQAMGNIRTLLGLGKKVYIKQSLTSTATLNLDGITTFCLDSFSLEPTFPQSKKNIEIIKEIFSDSNLKKCLANVFN